uniref:Uncharacterized protein n=1 Tax=Arundo donax TaxID=35708 RepID=A0A0A8YPR1_ARUDO
MLMYACIQTCTSLFACFYLSFHGKECIILGYKSGP